MSPTSVEVTANILMLFTDFTHVLNVKNRITKMVSIVEAYFPHTIYYTGK